MPTGPQGQKRLADVVGREAMLAKIVTSDTSKELREPSGKVRWGHLGVAARANKLSSEERSAIAKKAAAQRWK